MSRFRYRRIQPSRKIRDEHTVDQQPDGLLVEWHVHVLQAWSRGEVRLTKEIVVSGSREAVDAFLGRVDTKEYYAYAPREIELGRWRASLKLRDAAMNKAMGIGPYAT